jgi:O-antigen ligase
MIINSTHRTWAICFAILCFLIQTPDWSYIPRAFGYFIAFGLCLERVLSQDKITITHPFLSFCFVGFLSFCTASLLWSDVLYHSLNTTPLYALLPLICLSFQNTDDFQWDLFLKIVMGLCGLLAVYGLSQLVLENSLHPEIANGPFLNPNSFAVFVGIGFVIALYHTMKHQNFWRVIGFYNLCFLMILAIIATTSKSALLALIIVTAMAIIFTPSLRSKASIFKIILLAATSYGFVFLYGVFQDQTAALSSLSSLHQPSTDRWLLWQTAIEAGLNNKIWTGGGIGMFREIFKIEYMRVIDQAANVTGFHAHNDLLHLWVEIGLIGLAFVLGIAMVIAKYCFSAFKGNQAPYAMIILYCGMMGMVTPVILLPAVMVILAVSIGRISCRQQSISIPFAKEALSVFLVILMILAAQSAFDKHYLRSIKTAIADNDIVNVIETIDRLDFVSMRLNPSVPIIRASSLMALYDQNVIDPNQKENALSEIKHYVDDARRRNPYNVEVDYYEGELVLRHDKKQKAENFFETALAKDPTYISARLALSKTMTDKDAAYDLLKDGLNYSYWKQNPMTLYAELFVMATQRNDKDMLKKLRPLMQNSAFTDSQ